MYEKTVPRRYLYLLAFIIAFSLAAMILGSDRAEAATLNNPRIVNDPTMNAGQKVTWDCVYFGSYPQTEVICEDDDFIMKLNDMDELYRGVEYEEVNKDWWDKIVNADYDSNGDAVVGYTKYRRIKREDTLSSRNASHLYQWENGPEYHYFRYEPVKWRVLDTNGSNALLLADKGLDNQRYNISTSDDKRTANWDKSLLRSWMNGYDASYNYNSVGCTDKNFIDTAFDSMEQDSIKVTYVDNSRASVIYDTSCGPSTKDKIFALSEFDTTQTDKARSYGFVDSYEKCDDARVCKSTTYAKAMGAATLVYESDDDSYSKFYTDFKGSCSWWLRSPSMYIIYSTAVNQCGRINSSSGPVYINDYGVWKNSFDVIAVRPALNLDLSKNTYTTAGTVCSDGEVSEPPASRGWWSDNISWILDDDGTLYLEGIGTVPEPGDFTEEDFYYGIDESLKKKVKNIEFGSDLTGIGEGAFDGFDSLEKVTIPAHIRKIGNSAFGYCEALKYVEIKEGVKSLGDDAFAWADIKSITIPRSVTRIGDDVVQSYKDGYHAVIKGYSGTKADSYAAENGIKFWDIDKQTYKVSKVDLSSGRDDVKYYKTISIFMQHPYAKSYQIYRKSSSKGKYKKIKEVTAKGAYGEYLLNDKKLSFNKKYYYRVRPYIKANGKKYYGGYSYISVKTKLPKPGFNLSSTVKNGKRYNKVKWTKVSGATGYRVYQYNFKKKKYVLIADRSNRTNYFIHKNIKKGKRYRYIVRAYRKVNGKKILGVPSNPGSVQDGVFGVWG